jgi:hypothetical protein
VQPGAAVVEGIHAEGPVVADLGGLPPDKQGHTALTVPRFKKLVDAMAPQLKIMTIGPSMDADQGCVTRPPPWLLLPLPRSLDAD